MQKATNSIAIAGTDFFSNRRKISAMQELFFDPETVVGFICRPGRRTFEGEPCTPVHTHVVGTLRINPAFGERTGQAGDAGWLWCCRAAGANT